MSDLPLTRTITRADLGPDCCHCGKPSLGMRCSGCRRELKVGDLVAHVELAEGSPLPGVEGAGIFTSVCIECKAALDMPDLAPEEHSRVAAAIEEWKR